MAFHLNGTNKKTSLSFYAERSPKDREKFKSKIAGEKANFGISIVMICYRLNVLYKQENLEIRHNSSIYF